MRRLFDAGRKDWELAGHRSVADGEFVLVQAQGSCGPTPTAFYDSFRVADGKVAEHWGVVFPIPADSRTPTGCSDGEQEGAASVAPSSSPGTSSIRSTHLRTADPAATRSLT